jgi:hypothetical protein
MASTRRLRSVAMRDFIFIILLIGSQQQVNAAACEHFTFLLELQVEDIKGTVAPDMYICLRDPRIACNTDCVNNMYTAERT